MLVALVGISIVIVSDFSDVHSVVKAFSHVGWYVVPLVILAQLLSYLADAEFYQTFFAVWQRKVKVWSLYEISLATNFANVAIPSGGISGTAILAKSLRQEGIDISPFLSTLAQVCKYIFTYISFLLMLLGGFAVMFFANRVSEVSVRLALIALGVSLGAGLVAGAAAIYRSKFKAVIRMVGSFINFLGRSILRRREDLLPRQMLDDFLSGFRKDLEWVLTHRSRWLALMWWSIVRNFAEIATIYVVFISFGSWINPGVVITGYTFAIIASMVALPISGIGAYEAGMVGAFVALGIPFTQAFAVVVVYRVLNLGVFLPISFLYYRKYISQVPSISYAKSG